MRDDAPDARDRYATQPARYACGGWGREQEFVVFAAMERLWKPVWGLQRAGPRAQWQRACLYLRRNMGGLAKMEQIGGETIAQIDAGRSQPAPQKRPPCGQSRIGEQVRVGTIRLSGGKTTR